MLLAIDPGTRNSGFCEISTVRLSIGAFGNAPNSEILDRIVENRYDEVVVEEVAYSRFGGWDLMRTAWWSGAFCMWVATHGQQYRLLNRSQVTGTLKAKGDAEVRARCCEIFGGEQETKRGGSLYGVNRHVWAALGLGLAWQIRAGASHIPAIQKPVKSAQKKKSTKTP